VIVFEKKIEDFKFEKIKQLKKIVHKALQKTDWIVIKCNELGIDPKEKYSVIMKQRESLRNWCNQKEQEIKNAKTKKELKNIELKIPDEYCKLVAEIMEQ